MNTSFVHLHVHSSYSPMSGVASLEALCEAARHQGTDTFALTDTNGLYGAIRFLDVARDAKLKPILGAELIHDTHRAVLLAKTPEGYANLCRALSARHCDNSFDFINTVAKHRTGLIVLSDDEAALSAWRCENPEDLYVELTPGPLMQEAVALSRQSGLPPVATTRAHFLSPDDYHVHRLLRAIALNTTLSRLPQKACCERTHWLMPEPTLARYFPHVSEALTNTRRIADACYTYWNFKKTIFPSFQELSAPQAFDVLREKTYQGAARRYGAPLPSKVIERIEHELAVILAKGYADYFLVVEKIVRDAKRTCGRGSVAASIVSYCLEITHVDPLRHNLFFERFLNAGRHDPPDIDIDFPWDERDDIVAKVFNEYGARQTAMVANQNTLGLRAAIREVAKVYGIPAAEIGYISTLIMRRKDFLWFEEAPTAETWVKRLSHELRLQKPWPQIISSAVHVQHHFRNLSLHCGGLVIVPDEIRRHVPVEIAAKGVQVIQWEKDQTEEAGLVKIDLLGNRSLAVIRDALAAIVKTTGLQIDYAMWDSLSDPATQELIRQGETIGCFYIESPATRLLLKKLWGGMPPHRRAQADVFEYLVMVSSLVRPAVNPFIEQFIRRAQGESSYQPWHERLGSILDETHGIMVYQEDVTKVAMALADFSVEDADQLRKVISKKHKQKQLRDYYIQFCEGAAKNNVPSSTIALIWEMIMSFAGYSFCKPHSASYAQVSFKSAYLRAHHPAEFMAAVMSNQGGFYSTFAYLSETRRMGLTILPPDINASEWAYTGTEQSVRIGLMQVKTLREDLVKRMVKERQDQGSFRSLYDFLGRVRPDPAQAKILIKAGCFDSIAGELTRPALLWRLLAWQDGSSRIYLPIPPEYSDRRRLEHEMEICGFPLRCHPLELFSSALGTVSYVPARALGEHVGRRVSVIGWLITEKIVHTKHNEPMEFVTFEDTTALYDATIFPDLYRRCCHLLATNQAYVVTGRVEKQFSVVTLTVDNITRLYSPLLRASDDIPQFGSEVGCSTV